MHRLLLFCYLVWLFFLKYDSLILWKGSRNRYKWDRSRQPLGFVITRSSLCTLAWPTRQQLDPHLCANKFDHTQREACRFQLWRKNNGGGIVRINVPHCDLLIHHTCSPIATDWFAGVPLPVGRTKSVRLLVSADQKRLNQWRHLESNIYDVCPIEGTIQPNKFKILS